MKLQYIAIFAVLALLVACSAKTSPQTGDQPASGDAVSAIGNDVASLDDMSNDLSDGLSDDFLQDTSDIDNLELG